MVILSSSIKIYYPPIIYYIKVFIIIYNYIYNDDNGGLKFAQDAEGNWGYIIPGADTVNPFKQELLIPHIQNGIGGNATSQGQFHIIVNNFATLLAENINCSGSYAYVQFNYLDESGEKVLDTTTFKTGTNKNNFTIDISTVYKLTITITTQAGTGKITNLHLS